MGVIPDEELAALREEAYMNNDAWLAATTSMVRMSNEDPFVLSTMLLQTMAEMCRSHRELTKKYVAVLQCAPIPPVFIKVPK